MKYRPSELYAAFDVMPAGVSPLSKPVPLPDDYSDPLLMALEGLGWLTGPPNAEGWYPVQCPQEALHTAPGGARDTAYQPGIPRGRFKCMHGHCAYLAVDDLVASVMAANPSANLSADVYAFSVGAKVAKGLGLDTNDLKALPEGIETEEEIARRFAERWRGQIRYVNMWDKWLIWNGKYWEQDNVRLVLDRVRALCREIGASDPKLARRLGTAACIGAIERIARGRDWIASRVDEWDRNPWLLNTPDGTWDLKEGVLRGHDPAHMLTRMTSVSAAMETDECPIWSAFLERITGGNEELKRYLQRMAGYLLTGSIEEQAFFFAYGSGANGKSVFLGVLAGILADYHKATAIETFMAAKNERHPEELASLRGARLVTAVESEAGRHWAESRIKLVTGGEPIRARFMRQDSFEFTPEFKLLIAGNHKPQLRSVDEAIKRRLNMIPFTVTIPVEERDHALSKKLEAEWPCILAWAIEGCIEWRETGLAPPRCVVAASEAYFNEQDVIARWLEECCELDAEMRTKKMDLWNSWDVWASQSGENIGRPTLFYENLEKHGLRSVTVRGTRYFSGIKLINAQGEALAKVIRLPVTPKDDSD